MPDKKRSVCGIGSCSPNTYLGGGGLKNHDKTLGSWSGSEFEPVFLEHQT